MASRTRHKDEVQWIGSGRRGHLDGDGHNVELNRPFGVCALRGGMLAFTDAHNNAVRFVIRKPGCRAGRWRCCVKTLDSSGLLTPKGIAASADERHLFVCDTGHHKIRLAALPSKSALAEVDWIIDDVEMFAFAGSGKKGWCDGAAMEAAFNAPAGVCEHADGTIMVADTGNHCIRQIRRTTTGKLVVKTIAGAYSCLEARGGRRQTGEAVAASKRNFGYRDGERSLFRSPSAIIAGPHGELLVADTMNNCIRGLLQPPGGSSSWNVNTICGRVAPGHADGNCEVALFDQPVSLCWGANRNTFFVSDRGNSCIRQVGRSYESMGDCLSYSWVRTIEVGSVPRTLRPVRNQDLLSRSYPLGIVCIVERDTEREEALLVVCDGGENVIKLLHPKEVQQRTLSVDENERFCALKVSDARTVSTPHRSGGDSQLNASDGSLSPSTECPQSDELSENQSGSDCEKCSCESSRALTKTLEANAALQAENARLRELLECTFEEIELADKRFTQNYQPQVE